jgi:hypothetical protein
MEDITMPSILEKTRKQIKNLIKDLNEKTPQLESSNIFSAFNQRSNISSLKIDVKVAEDVKEDDKDNDQLSESGEDTVYGQGTPPNPEGETYLNLLKKTAPDSNKIKVKVKK